MGSALRTVGAPAAALVGAWLIAATAVGAAGVLSSAPRPVVLAAIVGLVVALVALGLGVPGVKRWALALDMRVPIVLHVIRAPIGIALLVAAGRSLPPEFAIHAGWGDLLVGLSAMLAARTIPLRTRERRRLLVAWNAVALLDILAVIVSAQFLLLRRPGSGMESLLGLPGSLLPTFVVPLVVAAHLVTFAQLRASRVAAHRRATDL